MNNLGLTIARLSLLSAAALGLTGCVRQVQSSVPAFAQAATLTSTNIQAAFVQVQETYADTQVMNYAVTYKGDFDPATITQTWLPQSSMDVRLKVLQGLSQYASELSSLSGSDDTTALNTASTGAGTALTNLTATPEFKNLTVAKSVSSDQVATAVNALGHWLIQAKLKKTLPASIEQMDPNIQMMCTLLIEDIGTVDTNPAHPPKGNGLRQTLWVEFSQQIKAWNNYVESNMSSFTPDARLAAIEKLPTLAAQQRQADITLQQAQVTVAQLGKAHTELVKSTQAKQDFRADLGNLVAETQRLSSYYQSLQSAK